MTQDRTGSVLNQDLDADDEDQLGIGQPVSQTEVDDLLYSETIPLAQRLSQLRALRDDMITSRAGDLGRDQDADGLVTEIEAAIARLKLDDGDLGETGYDNALPADVDPTAHRESLSPDDDLLLGLDDEDNEDDEEFEEEDVLDSTEWEDGDDFRPERGVH